LSLDKCFYESEQISSQSKTSAARLNQISNEDHVVS